MLRRVSGREESSGALMGGFIAQDSSGAPNKCGAASIFFTRRQHAHRRFGEEIAQESFRIAMAGPGLEAKERRAWPRPQSDVREILQLHAQAGPFASFTVDGEKLQPLALRIEKAQGFFKQAFGQFQLAARQRNRAAFCREKPAGRDDRHETRFGLIETEAMPPLGAGQGPAKARMQAASIGHGAGSRIRHMNYIFQFIVFNYKLYLK